MTELICDFSSTQWMEWPNSIPFPTKEEYDKAVELYTEELKIPTDPVDCSDWCMGLPYVMATSIFHCWKRFFSSLKDLPDDPQMGWLII